MFRTLICREKYIFFRDKNSLFILLNKLIHLETRGKTYIFNFPTFEVQFDSEIPDFQDRVLRALSKQKDNTILNITV
jgi:hypothetical protein